MRPLPARIHTILMRIRTELRYEMAAQIRHNLSRPEGKKWSSEKIVEHLHEMAKEMYDRLLLVNGVDDAPEYSDPDFEDYLQDFIRGYSDKHDVVVEAFEQRQSNNAKKRALKELKKAAKKARIYGIGVEITDERGDDKDEQGKN